MLELDALKYKALSAYNPDRKVILLKQKRSINFSLYQEALVYAKKKSLEDNDFMKKISEYRNQSKGQLNKVLSSPIQSKSCLEEKHANMEKVSTDCFTKQEKKIFLKEFGELKQEFKALKTEIIELKKIMTDPMRKKSF